MRPLALCVAIPLWLSVSCSKSTAPPIDVAAPPALSGGTLAVTADAETVVISDPDRDRIQLVNLRTRAVRSILLAAGALPGRIALDGTGRAFVALRGADSVAVVDLERGIVEATVAACTNPRGIAYEAATTRIHVVCASGTLLSFDRTLRVVRTVAVDRDVRDIVVVGTELWLSRFKSATLLRVSAEGAIVQRQEPPGLGGGSVARVAWRMLASPGAQGGAFMLHQHAATQAISVSEGGYAGGGACRAGIVSTGVTQFRNGAAPSAQGIFIGASLAIDAAISSDGRTIAMAVPGNAPLPESKDAPPVPVRAGNFAGNAQLVVYALIAPPPVDGGLVSGDGGGLVADAGTDFVNCVAPTSMGLQEGPDEIVAVAFVGTQKLVVQTRAPALHVLSAPTTDSPRTTPIDTIALGGERRAHPGFELFHRATSAGMACASCHPEATEDGHVWQFTDVGGRRTQSLRGGVLDTVPFHWSGDLADLRTLAAEVMHKRMAGPSLDAEQVRVLGAWMQAQPALRAAPPLDEASLLRGRALFYDADIGCARCHGGAKLTDNQTHDVGTGSAFQTPSLVGVGHRAPFMHDGCAPTLRERFTLPCGGGEAHGKTTHLPGQALDDLVRFLESL